MGSAMTFVIRRASMTDIPRVAELEAATQPRPWTEGIFRDEFSAENRTYLVADGPGIVGYGGVMVVDDEAHITNLLVAEESRGIGLGKELMIKLVEAALEMGARHLTLEVRSKNHVARSMYSRFGLMPVGVRKAYYGDDDALILWARDIDSEGYAARLEGLR